MLVQVIEINDVRNHDETKGEIAKKKHHPPNSYHPKGALMSIYCIGL